MIEDKNKNFAKPVSSRRVGEQVAERRPRSFKKIFSKPKKQIIKEEITVNKDEVVKKIVELHNSGMTKSGIGLFLKDEFKIKSLSAFLDKQISQVLNENGIKEALPEDLKNLLERAVVLQKHMKNNKKDNTAKRGYQITVSKIRKLSKYYKNKNILPKDWLYSAKKAALLVK
jgi:small subunit ribosomal protein S15